MGRLHRLKPRLSRQRAQTEAGWRRVTCSGLPGLCVSANRDASGRRCKLTQQLPVVEPDDAARYAGLYATAAIPARYWIERQQWDAAAALPLPPQASPGDAYASTQATLYFARALGASRLGDIKAAQSAMQPLLSLRDALMQSGDGDADQVNVQLKIVSAWIKWAEGDHDAALQAMRAAAAMEDATEKSPVSPGSIAPAPEMLGDMLLLAEQPKPRVGGL